jgi:HAD superfamily hydrolase (TIGR01509 family)
MRHAHEIGAFFDLDGLILDTEPLQLLATNHALASIDLQIPAEDWGQYVGSPTIVNLRRIVAASGAHADINELERLKDVAYMQACAEQLSVRPGVTDLLQALHEDGFVLALVTSSVFADAVTLLARVGLRELFEVVISGDRVRAGKPAPEPYLAACRETSMPAERCVALEDSRNGVLSAVKAGLACVAVPNSFTRRQNLTEANLIVDGFEALTARRLRTITGRMRHTSRIR